MPAPALKVVMYHYVRNLSETRFPRLNAMLLTEFRKQVAEFTERFEMATLESALEFLSGRYSARRDLCLLTFDDGLREHLEDVAPILESHRIQGLFFVITACAEYGRVAPVHQNHFLMALLGFEMYREKFLRYAGIDRTAATVDAAVAARTYPWDSPEVAQFKYLFNFVLDADARDRAVRELFRAHLGDEREFSRYLYFNWEEARRMQSAGMVLGGHTHEHRPLAGLPDSVLKDDLIQCGELLRRRTKHQALTPFCYPYGKADSFDDRAKTQIKDLGFCCAFTTVSGSNEPETDLFAIQRVDCKRAEFRTYATSQS